MKKINVALVPPAAATSTPSNKKVAKAKLPGKAVVLFLENNVNARERAGE
jgi:hypothetical protein